MSTFTALRTAAPLGDELMQAWLMQQGIQHAVTVKGEWWKSEYSGLWEQLPDMHEARAKLTSGLWLVVGFANEIDARAFLDSIPDGKLYAVQWCCGVVIHSNT